MAALFADASCSWDCLIGHWCRLQIKLPASRPTTLAAVQADCGRPLSSHLSVHYCSRFCSAVRPD